MSNSTIIDSERSARLLRQRMIETFKLHVEHFRDSDDVVIPLLFGPTDDEMPAVRQNIHFLLHNVFQTAENIYRCFIMRENGSRDQVFYDSDHASISWGLNSCFNLLTAENKNELSADVVSLIEESKAIFIELGFSNIHLALAAIPYEGKYYTEADQVSQQFPDRDANDIAKETAFNTAKYKAFYQLLDDGPPGKTLDEKMTYAYYGLDFLHFLNCNKGKAKPDEVQFADILEANFDKDQIAANVYDSLRRIKSAVTNVPSDRDETLTQKYQLAAEGALQWMQENFPEKALARAETPRVFG